MVSARERGYPVPGASPETSERAEHWKAFANREMREARSMASRRWRSRQTSDALWTIARVWCSASLFVAIVLGWVAVWRLITGAVYGAGVAMGTAWLVVFCAMWLLAAVDLFTAWLTDERRWR